MDILISAITEEKESPLLMIEYSTAVPTDDHKMQRSDVYYWSGLLKVPMMKISPAEKGMSQNFGGGSKITDEQEQRLAFERSALFFPIKWNTAQGNNVLPTKANALSCVPYSDAVQEIISSIINIFSASNTAEDFYTWLKIQYAIKYSAVFARTPLSAVKASIVNSERFRWFGNKLSVKINRFGHAMDPDRGALYYANMMVGAENTITEIQVNRSDNLSARGGYNALFDGLTRKNELLKYVANITNNIFTDENALHVFTCGLNIDTAIHFEKETAHNYFIKDDVLKNFLFSRAGMVAKTIFFLSTELRLTDKDRNIICKIRWNEAPILEYLTGVNTNNRKPIKIKPLTIDEAKEDIITFAGVELYKKMNCDLLAVSYPGAQGDRCILTGSGRNVLRTYVDIIAYKITADGVQVFLEECKENFSRSQDDVDKLNRIIAERQEELKTLLKKIIGCDTIKNIYISVAAKSLPFLPRFSVDYVFMFDLSSDDRYTYIDYAVEIINKDFIPLANNGRLRLDKLYIIAN